MKLFKINNLTRKINSEYNKMKFWVNKNKPELLIISSVTCSFGAIVAACIATNKANTILEPANKKITEIRSKLNNHTAIATGEVNVKVQRKKLAKTYLAAGGKLAALYTPSALLFSLSVVSSIGSHKIMKNRAMACAAAYTALDSSYKAYRKRVADKLGEKAEDLIHRDVTNEKVLVKKQDEQGNEIEVEEVRPVEHRDPDSEFVYLFDASNRLWNPSGSINADLLVHIQDELNNKLQAQGYLFLNDVFKALCIPADAISPTLARMGQTFGWLYDTSDTSRDCFVSLGITKPGTRRDFNHNIVEMLRYHEPNVWLEFNVDGDIVTPYDSDGNKRKTFLEFIKEY